MKTQRKIRGPGARPGCMNPRPVSGCTPFIVFIAILAVCMLLPRLVFSDPAIDTERLPSLPAPVSNNSVASVQTKDGLQLFSFLGLGAGKTWRDTLSTAVTLKPGDDSWTKLDDVPGQAGRLASTAATVGTSVFVPRASATTP